MSEDESVSFHAASSLKGVLSAHLQETQVNTHLVPSSRCSRRMVQRSTHGGAGGGRSCKSHGADRVRPEHDTSNLFWVLCPDDESKAVHKAGGVVE